MKNGVRALLFLALGFCLGVGACLAGFVWLGRHPESAGRVVRAVAPGASLMDPAQRLTKAEGALAGAHGEYDRWVALDDAAMLNAEAGTAEKAKAYADELLSLAPKYPRDWNYGNAVHKGNLALGLVALKSGDVASARDRLLAAGRTPGSPQLDSFGPNMVLAKALAERGEKESVLSYFELCGKFWRMDNGKLREWTALVKDGVVPDFGANLLY